MFAFQESDYPRSLRFAGDEGLAGAAVEVEGPGERFAMGGADEAGGFENRGHALWGVNESTEGVAGQAIKGVFQNEGGADEPLITGIGEGEQAARVRGREAKQGLHIGITADDAVERDDVGVGQGGGGHGEVAENELNGPPGVAWSDVLTREFEISGRGVRERDAGQAGVGEFHGDRANTGADVEKLKPLERRAAEFFEEHARGAFGAAALIAPQLTPRGAWTEEGGGMARARATGHAVCLNGAEQRDKCSVARVNEKRNSKLEIGQRKSETRN